MTVKMFTRYEHRNKQDIVETEKKTFYFEEKQLILIYINTEKMTKQHVLIQEFSIII